MRSQCRLMLLAGFLASVSLIAPRIAQCCQPPGIVITGPASGSTCGKGMTPVVLTATTTNGVISPVTGVEFYDGAVSIGSATGSDGNTWTYSWSTSAATLGSHHITANETDAVGLTGTSPEIIVKVLMPGDGNHDGSVDGLDYNDWQNGYNLPNPTFATGDFNGDGSVDGLDFNVWQNNYNHTATYVGDQFATMAAAPGPAAATVPAATNAPHIVAVIPEPGAAVGDVMRLTLVFDCAVEVGAGAVEVYGAAGGQNREFIQAYDDAARTLTLTWTKALAPDVYTVRVIADFVTAAVGGAPLDGETGDPASPNLPSGDGTPGGDARLKFEAR